MADKTDNEQSEGNLPAKSTPKDALVMGAILKEMGISDYEPRVINQMLEYTYREFYLKQKSFRCFQLYQVSFYAFFWSEDTALRHVFNLVIVRGLRAFHSSRIIIANLDETVIRLQSFSWTGDFKPKRLSANLVNKVVNKQSGCLL